MQTKAEQNLYQNFNYHIFNSVFLLTQHSSVSQILSWNWKHLINWKCRLLTHQILHSYLCNALCKIFIKVGSHYCFSKIYSEIESMGLINSSNGENILSCDSKELFVQHFVEVLDQNQKHVEIQNQRTSTPADFIVLW